MKRKILFLSFALPALLCHNLLAQSGSRLTAESHWSFGGSAFKPVDSSYFNYSDGRGGDLKHMLMYDNYTTWAYVDTAYQNSWYYVQTFDSTGHLSNTISEQWNTTSGTWVPVTNTLYTYDSMNRFVTIILQTWNGSMWVPSTEHVYSYNSNNKLYLDLLQNWNAFTLNWYPASQKTYYYNSGNVLINETDQAFIGGVPTYTTEYAYTYSSGMNTTTLSTWSGTGWVNDSLYTYTIDSTTGNTTMLLAQSYNQVTSVWVNATLHLYSSFVSGMPQTDIYQTWDSAGSGLWINMMEYNNTYNGFNQLTQQIGTSWNVVGLFEHAVNDPMANYYYSTYTTGVKATTSQSAGLNVYPVPAQNMLRVDVKWDEAQPASINIYDMQGRVVRRWDAASGTQYSSAVSVDNLPQGTYFIKVQGTTEQFVKQIVITH